MGVRNIQTESPRDIHRSLLMDVKRPLRLRRRAIVDEGRDLDSEGVLKGKRT